MNNDNTVENSLYQWNFVLRYTALIYHAFFRERNDTHNTGRGSVNAIVTRTKKRLFL